MEFLEKVRQWRLTRFQEIWELLGPFEMPELPDWSWGPDRFWRALAEQHCRPLNLSELGRQSGLAKPEAVNMLDELTHRNLLLRVPPHPTPPAAGSYHTPRLVLRFPALFLNPLGVTAPDSPALSGLLQRLLSGVLSVRVLDACPEAATAGGVSHWTSYAGREVDLMVEAPAGRIGYQFLGKFCPVKRDRGALKAVREAGLIDRGLMVYPGRQAYSMARGVFAVPLLEFLQHQELWTGPRPSRELVEAAERFNGTGDVQGGGEAAGPYPVGSESGATSSSSESRN